MKDVRGLLADLGPSWVVAVSGPQTDVVESVVISDPVHPVRPQVGALVLAVGHEPGTASFASLCDLARDGAASAVVVKGDCGFEVPGLTVLVVDPVVDWAQLVTLFRAATGWQESAEADSLFDLAEALASLSGGPIVMHDSAWELVAYSGGQPHEEARNESILDRRAPRQMVAQLREQGVVDLLARGEVVHVRAGQVDGLGERYAVGVVAGGHFLGSLWAVPADDLAAADAFRGLRRAAEVAALPLLRHVSAVQAREAERDAVVASLLTGARTDRVVAERLGVEVDHGFVLAGLRPVHDGAAERVAASRRLLGLARSYLEAYRVHGAVASVSDTLYLVFPSQGGLGRVSALRTVTDLHARLQRAVPHRAMVSSQFGSLAEAAATRTVVDELLDLADRRGWSGLTDGDAVQASWRLEQFREVALAHPALLQGPIMRLVEHDRATGGELVPTLRAWFEHVGDARRTAEQLDLHVNTVRYRLRRAEEVAGLDLDNPDERLLAELQVRLLSS